VFVSNKEHIYNPD